MNIYLKLYAKIPLTKEEYNRLPAQNYKEYGAIPFFIPAYMDAWYDDVMQGENASKPMFEFQNREEQNNYLSWIWKQLNDNITLFIYLPQLVSMLDDDAAEELVNACYERIQGTSNHEIWVNHFSYKFNYSYLSVHHLLDYVKYLLASGGDITVTAFLNLLSEDTTHPLFNDEHVIQELCDLLTQYAHKELIINIQNNAVLLEHWGKRLSGHRFAFPMPSQSLSLYESEKVSIAFVAKVLSYPIEQRWYFMWNYKAFYGVNNGAAQMTCSKQQILKTLTMMTVCCPEYNQSLLERYVDTVLDKIHSGHKYSFQEFFESCFHAVIQPTINMSLSDIHTNIHTIIDNEQRIQHNLIDYKLGLKQASFMTILSEYFDCQNQHATHEIPLYV